MHWRSLMNLLIGLALISLPVSLVAPAFASHPAQSELAPMVTLTANGVVRAWPDSGADQVGTIPNRFVVPVSGRAVDFTWWQIPYPDGPGGFGWLAATVVLPNGTAASVPVIQVIVPTPAPAPVPPPAPVAPTPIPASNSCTLDAAFVADVTIPDGTSVGATQALNKVWRMRNTGTCTWDNSSVLRFVGGFKMAAPDIVNIPTTPAGATVDIALQAYAPAQAGTFQSVWQLVYQPGALFYGPRITMVIRVPGAPAPQPQPQPQPPKPQPPKPRPGPLSINFWAEHTSLRYGGCTKLHWDVDNAQRVDYYDGKKWKGVVGHDSHKQCPKSPTNYTLRVTDLSNNTHDRSVKVDVAFKPVPNPNPPGPKPRPPHPAPNPNPYDPPGPVPNPNPYDPPGPVPNPDPDDPDGPVPNPNPDDDFDG